VREAGRTNRGMLLYLCECVCGAYRSVRTSDLTLGRSRSCGCGKGLSGAALMVRNARRLEHQGEALTIREWSDRLSIPQQTIRYRLSRGWSVAESLSTPVVSPGRVTGQRTTLTRNGVTLPLPVWAQILGVHVDLLTHRVSKGISDSEVLRGLWQE